MQKQPDLFDMKAPPDLGQPFDFDGETYEPDKDRPRLNRQLQKVYSTVKAGRWHTLRELSDLLDEPEASISARLRDLRKPRFGSFEVQRRRRGDEKKGIFEYRLNINE